VEVVDASGNSARVPLSRYGAIRRPLEMSILRRRDLEPQRFPNQWELILQDYSIPMSHLVEASPGFQPDRIAEIHLVFDQAPAGSVVVGEIGIDPGR
jgi:hypothetical protein